jgi:hypothetical protein
MRSAALGILGSVAVLLGLLASPARAELCDPASGICVVNPPSAASPWVAPQVVQLRLPADSRPEYSGASWTEAGIPGGEWPRPLSSGIVNNGLQLLEQGPPGGTSLYQATLRTDFAARATGVNSFAPADGTLSLTVMAGRSDPSCTCIRETTAAFPGLPVLGAIAGFDWRIARGGGFFRAVMSFGARTPVAVEQLFHISGYSKGEIDFLPLPLMRREVTGAGTVRVVQKLSTRYVRNRCRLYRRCDLVAEAILESPGGGSETQGLLSSISRRIATPERAVRPTGSR